MYVLAVKSAHCYSQHDQVGGGVIHETDDMTLMLWIIGESDAFTTISVLQPSPISHMFCLEVLQISWMHISNI